MSILYEGIFIIYWNDYLKNLRDSKLRKNAFDDFKVLMTDILFRRI